MSGLLSVPKGLPLPKPEMVTAPFWEACAQRKLVIQRCSACGAHRHTPAPLCPKCRSREHVWDESKGTGEVYTFTVARHPVHPSLKEQLPYAVVVVKLDDCGGVCITSNLTGADPDKVRIGMRVKLAWDEVKPGVILPRFLPA